MSYDTIIERDEITVKPLTLEDCEKYRVLRNRDDNRVFFYDNSIISKEQQVNWFNKYIFDDKDYMYSVFYNDCYVGGLGIYNINYDNKSAEIGRIIIDRYLASGKGLGAKSLLILCDIASCNGLKKIYAYIKPDNIASIRIFLKAGFILSNLNDKCYVEKIL